MPASLNVFETALSISRFVESSITNHWPLFLKILQIHQVFFAPHQLN
jgi:hypothetical protein